jgi:hypothetical protein
MKFPELHRQRLVEPHDLAERLALRHRRVHRDDQADRVAREPDQEEHQHEHAQHQQDGLERA